MNLDNDDGVADKFPFIRQRKQLDAVGDVLVLAVATVRPVSFENDFLVFNIPLVCLQMRVQMALCCN